MDGSFDKSLNGRTPPWQIGRGREIGFKLLSAVVQCKKLNAKPNRQFVIYDAQVTQSIHDTMVREDQNYFSFRWEEMVL